MRATHFMTCSSLFCWPPLRPSALSFALRSMMSDFNCSSSFRSAGLIPAPSVFFDAFFSSFFGSFLASAAGVAAASGTAAFACSGTGALDWTTKKPFFGSRPLITLQASMYCGFTFKSEICLLFAVLSFLLSLPVNFATSSSRAAISASASALNASAAARSVFSSSAALKSFSPSSACFIASPMPATRSASRVAMFEAELEGAVEVAKIVEHCCV
mmetsp:Transcript_94347/g.293444  ORF Transcript_94347/g.293444 Transcript_94347/m.293444 type:complete len:215 (+) Transcript_94347:540-1184(+)